ncbi:MAG: alpha/beta hydrolase, partial [Rhodospirillaceae bacterium]|nr:alpha/beta hydrolase [Rhodospirillaceae bacterium]
MSLNEKKYIIKLKRYYFTLKTQNKTITHPDGTRLAFFSYKGSEPGIIFFSGYKSDMNGKKASSIQKFCIDNNISFTKFDYFGHGKSEGKFEDGTISRWLEDSLLIFDKVTKGKQILIGSSMGSWLMFLLAIKRKEKISGVIGIASAPDFTKAFWENLKLETKKELIEKGIFWQNSQYNDGKTPITYKLIVDSKKHYILEEEINIDCPVRLIHGLKDNDAPYTNSIELAKKIASSDISIYFIPKGDHRLSKPNEINGIIELLKEI